MLSNSHRVCRAARRPNTRLGLLAMSAVLISWLLVPVSAGAAAQPSAFCTDGLARLDIRAGQGIPLPSGYANPTSSTVTFTVTMRSTYFFGPSRAVAKVVLPPHLGVSRQTIVPTYLHTPLGNGDVVMDVTSSATDGRVVGRCNWQVHLSAVKPSGAGAALLPALRWTYQVPVQMCAMEGTSLAGSAKAGQTVAAGSLLETLIAVDKEIWHPQAQLAFSSATDTKIPVVADPTPPSGVNGALGDVMTFRADLEDIADLCTQAWAQKFPGRSGIPVVLVHAFIDEPGTYGISPPPPRGLRVASRDFGTGKRGDALCGSPVRLLSTDLVKPFVTMSDAGLKLASAAKTLAHELGHNLYLGHGNGLDDNHDGRPAGTKGPRRYDEYCDPGWLAPPTNTNVVEEVGSDASCSLMARAICSSLLRPLQQETARGVARFLRGFVDGTPVQVIAPTSRAANGPTVNYSASSSSIANPERGFYHHRGDCDEKAFDVAKLTAYRTQENVSLVMCIFYLRGLTDQAIGASTLAFFNQQAQAVRDAGLKMIVRFAYTDEDSADAPLARVKSHIDQLAPLLSKNSDVIDVVQSGFVGRWGEGYYTDNYGDQGQVTQGDWNARKEIVDKLLSALPKTRMVQLRTPDMKRQMYGMATVSSAQAYGVSNLARIGHHNDCFLASPKDQGTFINPAVEYPYLQADSTFTAVGGETCALNPPRSSCPTAMSELAKFHYSYLNTDYRPEVLDAWGTQGCLGQVAQRLSYRFTMKSGHFPTTVKRGSSLPIQISISNTGFATPHNPRPVWLVLRRTTPTKASFRVRLNTDPRRWAAGTTTTMTQNVPIPTSAPAGSFELLLSLPDPTPTLGNRAAYAIRMANANTWESSTGLNKLLAVVDVQ